MVGGATSEPGFFNPPTSTTSSPYPFNVAGGGNLDPTSTTEITQLGARNAVSLMTPGSVFGSIFGGGRRRHKKKLRFSKRKRIYGGSLDPLSWAPFIDNGMSNNSTGLSNMRETLI